MDPEDRRLLIEIHGDVKSLVPEVRANTRSLEKIEERTGKLEVRAGESDVRIERAQEDIDGLGRKVRVVSERAAAPILAAPAPAAEGGKWWIAGLEALAALPKFWHVFLSLGSIATTAFVILYKHWPGR
jgi:hypothetical protein